MSNEEGFYNKKQLREVTSLSIQHITRLENEGKFPKRTRLTDAKNGRVGWWKPSVREWMISRLEKST